MTLLDIYAPDCPDTLLTSKVRYLTTVDKLLFDSQYTDDRLVLRHRRPVTNPYPNRFSHSLPIFTFLPKTHQITVTFAVDPIFHASDDALKAAGARPVTPTRGTAPRSAPTTPTHTTFSTPGSTYVLASIPKRAPPSLLTSFSSFISENTTALLGHAPKSTPEAVFNGHIDLREDEVLEEERGEAAEVDDSPDHKREVRVVREHEGATGSAVSRRQWEVLTLRENRALTGAM